MLCKLLMLYVYTIDNILLRPWCVQIHWDMQPTSYAQDLFTDGTENKENKFLQSLYHFTMVSTEQVLKLF